MKKLDETNIYLDRPNQSWQLRQHAEHNGYKLRFRVRKGAYESTSHACVDVQDKDNLKWNTIASIPAGQMKSEMCYAVEQIAAPCNKTHTMLQDLAELERLALMLV